MPKDYAKNIFMHGRKPPKKQRRFTILLAVLLVVSAAAAFFYLKNNRRAVGTVQQVVGENSVHFDFYTDRLASESKALPVRIEEPVKSMVPSTGTNSFIVQIGVFNSPLEVGQVRVSLLLSGIEADIVKVRQGKDTIYRLQRGPYTSIKQAKQIQQKMKNKGIESEVKTDSL